MTKKCLISLKFSWKSHCPYPSTPEYSNPVLPLSLLPALNFAQINHKKGLPLTNLVVKRYLVSRTPACF